MLPSLLLSNVRSLRPKYDELCVIASSMTPNVIVLCETWLNDDITDQEIMIPHYNLSRCDRSTERRGGGVCAYINDNVRYEQIMTHIRIPNCILHRGFLAPVLRLQPCRNSTLHPSWAECNPT